MKSSLILSWSCVRLLTTKSQDVMRRIFHFFLSVQDRFGWKIIFSWFLLLCLPVYRWNWEIVSRLTPVTGCWKLKVAYRRAAWVKTLAQCRCGADGIIEIKNYIACLCVYLRHSEWVREKILQFMRLSSSMFTSKTLNALVCVYEMLRIFFLLVRWLNYLLGFTARRQHAWEKASVGGRLRFIAIVNWCQHHN